MLLFEAEMCLIRIAESAMRCDGICLLFYLYNIGLT